MPSRVTSSWSIERENHIIHKVSRTLFPSSDCHWRKLPVIVEAHAICEVNRCGYNYGVHHGQRVMKHCLGRRRKRIMKPKHGTEDGYLAQNGHDEFSFLSPQGGRERRDFKQPRSLNSNSIFTVWVTTRLGLSSLEPPCFPDPWSPAPLGLLAFASSPTSSEISKSTDEAVARLEGVMSRLK